ncbi:MAG: nitric oxide reductase activation protein NorD, partial [Pseudomonadaceae bacterium]|nr:nitric oxide reductase activation protein NorD [Pseudomonadaceae bacterium]
PNDLDVYEGRYGMEDTRQALLEARRAGIQPFCVTIDQQAADYLPYLFGQQRYQLIRQASELPGLLPKLYLLLTGRSI